MRAVRVGLLVLLASACGGHAPAPQAPTKAPESAPPAAHESLGPSGEDIDRLCKWYDDSLRDQGDEVAETTEQVMARCQAAMKKRTPAERSSIADCFNSCGASDGIVRCFEDFGTPSFPACGPEEDDFGPGPGSDDSGE
jgi:hypothetical protein